MNELYHPRPLEGLKEMEGEKIKMCIKN